MSKILVTGSNGRIGRKTLEQLLKVVPASELLGLARDPAKSADLAAKGIEIREGDSFDYNSLLRAFDGVEKLLLISAHGFTDRFTQHYNAITAARQVGVKQIAFTAIIRKEGSGFVMPEVTESDIFTEQTLKASGLTYTILRHPPFFETMQFYLGEEACDVGVRVPAGSGKVAPATMDELAAANVPILTKPGHENKTYTLSGSDSASFADIAKILSEIKGKSVPYLEITDQQYIENYVSGGLPAPLAGFALGWVQAINRGQFGDMPGDLEKLIGRKTTTFRDALKNYPVVAPELEALKAPQPNR